MDAIYDARPVLDTFARLGLPAPERLSTAVAVHDAFAAWRAEDPLIPLIDSLPTLTAEKVPAMLDQVADRLAITSAAKAVLTTAIPAANRQVAQALGQHGEDMIRTLRTPYLKAADKLTKLASQLPTDDPADAITAGDAAVKALRALPEVVSVLEDIRKARLNLDRRLGVADLTDPLLLVKADQFGLAFARSHRDDTGPGGMWLPLARAGLEFWLPTPAEASGERQRQAHAEREQTEAQRQAAIHAPGSPADYWDRYGPPSPTAA